MKRNPLILLVVCSVFCMAAMQLTGCGSSSSSSTSSTDTATTTTLKSSASSTTTGASITLTATVSASAATGTVTFYNGTTSLGSGTLSSGVATLSTSFSTAGTDSITATYGGDSNYAASTSSAISLTVTSSGSTSTTISMIAIPAGTFFDGVSYMTISAAFNMSEYPITQAQYKAVMGTNPSAAGSGSSNPVDSVSWYEALVFCNTLSIADGLTPVYSINGSTTPSVWGTVPSSADMTWDEVTMLSGANGYRLPTTSEYLWASMGGLQDGLSSDIVANSTYGSVNQSGYLKGYAGSTEASGGQTNIANYCWETNNSSGTTQPVGQKNPNELGLYDMCGNVSEWTWDYYWGIEQGAQVGGGTASIVIPFPSTPETDYTGLAVGTGKWRWLLGGSYDEDAAGNYVILPQGVLNSSGILEYVDAFNPSNVQSTHGFRVVKGGVF